MTKKERIKECRNGASYWVCFECSKKYSEREPYDGRMTVHNRKCFICEKEYVEVAPSRKLFGFYKSV